MKRFTSIAIILMVAMLAMPVASHAFENLLEIDIAGGSGEMISDFGDADIDMAILGAAYTRYFTALETTEGPYAMREFLQHPSYLNVGLESQTMEVTMEGGLRSMEDTEGTISLGGMYYLPNGTGLGGALISSSSEEERKFLGITMSKDETTDLSLVLSVNHYVADNMSFGVDLTSLASETKTDSGVTTEKSTQQTLDFKGSSLINNMFWISGLVGVGELEVDKGPIFDVSRFELEAGFFPMQKLGVMLSVGTEKIEGDYFESTETFTTIALDYSITESINVRTAIISFKGEEDEGGDVTEIDLTALNLGVGVLF
ncbi:MAG: hypothetical protein KAR83_02175 [Thermodesulfovibrionales bacterium]|nr:hypothetical protein [Thermodesulfovibrionales bacterium]